LNRKKRNEIPVIVRGVRDEKDLAYEIPMAKYNLAHGGAETLLLLADEAFADTSSSRVRESLVGGTGDAYPLLPAEIRDEICEKWAFFHQECP
jgi:phosphopantetheine adenylyltransferase